VIALDDIRRLPLGHFTRPADETPANAKIVVAAYLINHPGGLVLFDSGIAEGNQEVDGRYHPVRRPLAHALGSVGLDPGDVDLVVNCHLHADHCGGNALLAGRPIFTQRGELEAAQGPDYTEPSAVDFPGARYELLDGEAEILPGIRVVPTPGHVAGHQSLVVDCEGGPVVLAGQAYDSTSEYTLAQFAWSLGGSAEAEPDGAAAPDWLAQLQEREPRRVLFAHDLAVWEAEPALGPILPRRPRG
jgi:N-acyl homoserine lactone hydrolase